MDILIVTIVAVGGTAVMFVLMYRMQTHVQTRIALKKARRTTVADFPAPGLGKVVGTLAYDAEPLTAPLTGRSCAYYEVYVEEKYSGTTSSGWTPLVREKRGVPFVLVDDTGRAMVDPESAKFALVIDTHSRSGVFADPNEREQAFLDRYGVEAKGWVLNKGIRYREGALEEGEEVAVLGHGTREPDPKGQRSGDAYRELPPTRLRIVGAPGAPLLISDNESALGSVPATSRRGRTRRESG